MAKDHVVQVNGTMDQSGFVQKDQAVEQVFERGPCLGEVHGPCPVNTRAQSLPFCPIGNERDPSCVLQQFYVGGQRGANDSSRKPYKSAQSV